MTNQTQTTSICLREFAFLLPPTESIHADSRDYGFDFDEDELGLELAAPLPACLSIQSLPEVDADAFESTFQHFLS